MELETVLNFSFFIKDMEPMTDKRFNWTFIQFNWQLNVTSCVRYSLMLICSIHFLHLSQNLHWMKLFMTEYINLRPPPPSTKLQLFNSKTAWGICIRYSNSIFETLRPKKNESNFVVKYSYHVLHDFSYSIFFMIEDFEMVLSFGINV